MPVEDSNVLEILVGATHPRLIECLLDMMDSNPDARSMLAREYEKEWPERAERFFHALFRERGEVI